MDKAFRVTGGLNQIITSKYLPYPIVRLSSREISKRKYMYIFAAFRSMHINNYQVITYLSTSDNDDAYRCFLIWSYRLYVLYLSTAYCSIQTAPLIEMHHFDTPPDIPYLV